MQDVGVVGRLPVGHHRLAGDAVDIQAAAHGGQDVLRDTQASAPLEGEKSGGSLTQGPEHYPELTRGDGVGTKSVWLGDPSGVLMVTLLGQTTPLSNR